MRWKTESIVLPFLENKFDTLKKKLAAGSQNRVFRSSPTSDTWETGKVKLQKFKTFFLERFSWEISVGKCFEKFVHIVLAFFCFSLSWKELWLKSIEIVHYGKPWDDTCIIAHELQRFTDFLDFSYFMFRKHFNFCFLFQQFWQNNQIASLLNLHVSLSAFA